MKMLSIRTNYRVLQLILQGILSNNQFQGNFKDQNNTVRFRFFTQIFRFLTHFSIFGEKLAQIVIV